MNLITNLLTHRIREDRTMADKTTPDQAETTKTMADPVAITTRQKKGKKSPQNLKRKSLLIKNLKL